MRQEFHKVRDIIIRVYNWFRNKPESKKETQRLTADTEATMLRLFGPKAFENLQLASMDLESLLDKVDSHNVEYSAVAAYEIRLDANVLNHFTASKKRTDGTLALGDEYKT